MLLSASNYALTFDSILFLFFSAFSCFLILSSTIFRRQSVIFNFGIASNKDSSSSSNRGFGIWLVLERNSKDYLIWVNQSSLKVIFLINAKKLIFYLTLIKLYLKKILSMIWWDTFLFNCFVSASVMICFPDLFFNYNSWFNDICL